MWPSNRRGSPFSKVTSKPSRAPSQPLHNAQHSGKSLFAFVYNAVGVPIATGVLYPFFGVLLSPILAAAAMSFSSGSMIFNSLRLRRVVL